MTDPAALFRGKKITVMGLGLLGRGLGDALFLIRCGARVTVTDLKTADELAPSLEQLRGLPVSLRLGGHHADDFIHADMILRNADVPRSSRFLQIAAEHNVPVEMDESLFCKHFSGKVIGITGTRGKTTTTTLVHSIVRDQRSGVFLGGNIQGTATLPLLEWAGSGDIVVMELSSWQLQGFHDAGISPSGSVFTNIYPDHLNRYANMEEYIQDKKAIYLYQKDGDFCLFNGDRAETRQMAEEAPAETILYRGSDVPADWKLKIRGEHNRSNVAAALTLARRLDIPDSVARRVVEEFEGVEHRLQWLGRKGGVGFVNDSTSTTPVAACAALESYRGYGILLIAGGASKNLDLQPLASAAISHTKRIALLEGTATDDLRQRIVKAGGEGKIVGTFTDLGSAVDALRNVAQPEDIILLSPGCASFGMFRNEFHRGDTFINIVNELPD